MRLRRSGRGHTLLSGLAGAAILQPAIPRTRLLLSRLKTGASRSIEARAKLRAAGKKLKHAPKSAWEGPRAWS